MAESAYYLGQIKGGRPCRRLREKTMENVEDLEEVDSSGIAQYLSELSQEGRLPQGVEQRVGLAPFQQEEVSFDDNDWLKRTLSVQAWMCLDSPISSNGSPSDAAISLFEQVSPDPADACIAILENSVRLTALGAQHLETWLSRAVANREAFLEDLEEDQSLREASEDWVLLWEEGGANRAMQPASIQARVDTTTIRTFADYAGDGDLELNPSYQRDNVWSTSDSQLLIDSILRGIPIPSIILTEVGHSRKFQIVDGKQRLTAILRFVGQHPAARAFAKEHGVTDLLERDPKKLVKKLHLRGRDIPENYLPFKLPIYPAGDPLSPLSGKYLAEIRGVEIDIGQGKVIVGDIFGKANSKYKIPTIIYENTRLQDIHHVFSIYNKQGKKLNAEELRNATYHHLGLTKLLLALSGDRPDVDELAPYLPSDVRDGLGEVGLSLRSCGFGTLRFKRTKVLSWTCAIFLHAPKTKPREASYVTPSTASHIDSLLYAISTTRQGQHPLYQNATLVTLARDIRRAVTLHGSVEDAWSPRFRSKKGHASRWEELPLVASLLTTLVLVATGNETLLEEKVGLIRAVTEASPGPQKTQNKTQWEYIAMVCMRVFDALKVNQEVAGATLSKRYGYNCIEVMHALAASQTA
jgi:hypothetical protein